MINAGEYLAMATEPVALEKFPVVDEVIEGDWFIWAFGEENVLHYRQTIGDTQYIIDLTLGEFNNVSNVFLQTSTISGPIGEIPETIADASLKKLYPSIIKQVLSPLIIVSGVLVVGYLISK